MRPGMSSMMFDQSLSFPAANDNTCNSFQLYISAYCLLSAGSTNNEAWQTCCMNVLQSDFEPWGDMVVIKLPAGIYTTGVILQ